jgi:DNA-binding Lrp family transcriptional regulator
MTTTHDRAKAATPRPGAAGRVEFDELTRRLLDVMQEEFPLAERPYEALGARIGVSEADALRRIREARDARVIRQICAIYDTKALGYSSALVAMKVPDGRLAQAAAVVNAHPGVSHNYRRSHEFNMWFTVAMPPGNDLDAVIWRLHELAGAESTRPMPTLRLFKIEVQLDMSGQRALTARGEPAYSEKQRRAAARDELTSDDIGYIRATQGDLRDVARPFDDVAEALDWPLGRVFAHAAELKRRGFMRRYAAILNHRTAGFRANGMAVWRVPEECIESFGLFVAGYRNVTHCYRRPTYPDWPYNVFSMLHHPKVAGVEETAQAISRETGVDEYRVLYSTTEFKKVRLPYFVPEYDRWEELCEAAARAGGLPS